LAVGREEGFAIADIASNHMDDEKVRRLWRVLEQDSTAMCEAVTAHFATVLASWREGKRVKLEEAAPLWLHVRPEITAALMAVGLLDRQKRVPARTWAGWYEPARARREARRDAGRSGGLAKAKRSSSVATAEAEPSSTRPAVRPDRPTVPSGSADPSNGRAPRRASGAAAARGGDTVSFREAVAAAGYNPEAKS